MVIFVQIWGLLSHRGTKNGFCVMSIIKATCALAAKGLSKTKGRRKLKICGVFF